MEIVKRYYNMGLSHFIIQITLIDTSDFYKGGELDEQTEEKAKAHYNETAKEFKAIAESCGFRYVEIYQGDNWPEILGDSPDYFKNIGPCITIDFKGDLHEPFTRTLQTALIKAKYIIHNNI